VPLLVRLIRMNDQLVKDFIEKYFNQALGSFFEYQRQFEEQMRKVHGLPTPFPSVTAWTQAMIKPFASAFVPSAPASDAGSRPTGTDSTAASGRDRADLEQLVRELQSEVRELKKAQEPQRAARGAKRPKKTR
jgi:polyhydroxyalkanoate synthesis regulator protein